MAIQIRRGNKADLQAANLLPGEQVLATDTGEVGIKSAGGDIIWYATTAGTNNAFLAAHPVGAIYMSADSANPGTLFGGTWIAWGTGRVPVGIDTAQAEFSTVEKTGGEKTHVLTIGEAPTHSHTINDDGNALVGRNGTYVPTGSFGVTKTSAGRDSTFVTNSQGGGGAHNNLQPYITCYMWKRTA